ncbi:1,4-alpha-glucan branching enzyme GlgB [Clostridium neonatale]|uniref:1,4-alpha-glucan branching protein GlgB n=1 Tax=Clostridium neonatale TaxID=137838 RepID=UPI00291BD75D|nr:1,4-alpha-glucan branching enzyme GlgB [Clostridium neonatale]CAI3674769.1 1,4-alpha-glucan branching enzyme GlgB [Clostridium neonatale]CAI3675693.1 1,4-alpha-glucan branching enzyme GlgB [Clostridium neonatale]CAI3677074.1 1,4-alpha-glucan branching enzyme GlgB [Clostridium neonatale]CAI3693571.1 1,4-alpha-glucan branching enzyme GlgB [Clostridium neonatale]
MTKERKVKKREIYDEEISNVITENDIRLFKSGIHYEIYKKLGAHPKRIDDQDGISFSVWAPNAQEISVIGDFNGWDIENNKMNPIGDSGIFELFIPGALIGQRYKYAIKTLNDEILHKSDPYANYSERRPGNASVVTDISNFNWSDNQWLKKRQKLDLKKKPMSIYEVHIGSWKKHRNRDEDGFYNYKEFSHSLTEYILDMGYTHVELMGIAEYPFDGSWGYQVTGYYAPTSRYGTPEDFMYLINYLHKNNIGVILDWVPAHFPKDEHGLAEFDGTCLYEYSDKRKGEHADWGTKVFDYEKPEVKNFLIANALFWIENFHIDGLRVDAVSSMLYLDYGRCGGEWIPNKYGGNQNLEAIEFFKHLNTIAIRRNPGIMMIAEESTAWPRVTDAAENDGLNFTFKWNMGWMHDFLEYMKLDPYFRKDNHNKMTFSMSYNHSEEYILVLSHDEVVHLKCSMINKMPGELEERFKNLKVGYAFMFAHPGKKLLFMGQDFAQLREWSEERELDWYLLADENHRHINNFVKALLKIYKKYSCMYELDRNPNGFKWINANDNYRSIFSFVRYSEGMQNSLLFVLNFTPVERPDYKVGVPEENTYRLILNSDDIEFGGKGEKRRRVYKAVKEDCDGYSYSIKYSLPAYGVAVFVFK